MTPTLVVYLPVKDVDASVIYYTKALGLSVDEPGIMSGYYAHLWLAGAQNDSRAQIMLRKWPEKGKDDGETKPAAHNLMFQIDEAGKGKEVVDEKFAAVEKSGVHIDVVEGPADKPWLCRQFELNDPDGHHITFFCYLKGHKNT